MASIKRVKTTETTKRYGNSKSKSKPQGNVCPTCGRKMK